jgi:hypothetical protein
MQIIKVIKDLENIPSSILAYYKELGVLEDVAQTDTMFNTFGGNLYIIENDVDFAYFLTAARDIEGNKLNLFKKELVFDVCEYLKGNAFIFVHSVTNDGGGDAYAIPRRFATAELKGWVKSTKNYWVNYANN